MVQAKSSSESPRIQRPKIKEFKLNALLEVTKAINSNVPTSELLKIFEEIVRHNLGIGKLVLYSNAEDGWRCLLQYGVDESFTHIDVDREFAGINGIRTIDFSHRSLDKSFEIIIPVFHKESPLAYVLIGDINEQESGMSAAIKHLPFVQTLTNLIIVAIENKKLAKENLRQAAMNRELELAWEMQRMLFPASLPNDDFLEMHAVYLPHQQVGGDYYDFIRLNESEIAFCVADVSGKGVPAALLMSNFQASLRILLQHIPSLSDLVRELNTRVMDNAKGEKFITLFLAKYNTVTRMLNYVNAGHNPPLLVGGESVNLLTVGCTGIGMFDELHKVKEGVINVEPDTTIFCYTDGLVEQEDGRGSEFGLQLLQQLILANALNSPEVINQSIISCLVHHKGEKDYVDDIALFSCRLK
jgi:phosphoserine phosphatase RsbU/P